MTPYEFLTPHVFAVTTSSPDSLALAYWAARLMALDAGLTAPRVDAIGTRALLAERRDQGYVNDITDGGDLTVVAAVTQLVERNKEARLDESTPSWRDRVYDNGSRMFAPDGTMLDPQGHRSIFDDLDC